MYARISINTCGTVAEEFIVRVAASPADIAGARAVRLRVFVEEQGVSPAEEYDELDAVATHAVALYRGEVIGTARLLEQGPGMGRIGRMAVDIPWRRRGVGSRLLVLMEAQARERGYAQVMLHAQTAVQEFYARLGYAPAGELFLEAGIEHITMTRTL